MKLILKGRSIIGTKAECLKLSSDWDWDWEWDWESRIENRNSPSADSKISWATHHHHPQLLEVKEHSDNKVPLVRMS